MFRRWSIFALSFALASVAVVVVRSQQYGDTNSNNNNNNDNNNPPSNQYVFPTSGDGYTKGKKYQVDTTNDNPPGVPANADNLQLFDAWTTGDALTSQQLALIAEKLGGIVVYIFSYLFMASVFVSYILGVVILMIFKIMFGAFLPVASVELQSLPVYNVTQAPSSGSGGGGSSGGGNSGGNSYGTGSGGGSASYGSGGSGGGGGGSRYKRSMEMDLAFGREARALMPYTIDGNQMDYMDQNAGLFDRTKAFLNRGYATGRFMFDVLKQPECQKYIMCSTSSTFREERSGGVRYRDMLRQITPVVGRLARSVDDLTQSVNLGAMVGRCHHPTMNCPALQPAVHKMNELLQYLGVKAQ